MATLTRRERLLTVFARGVPDRVPIGMDCWPKTRRRIYDYYGAANHYDFYEKSGVDNFSLWDWPAAEPVYVGPPRPHIKHHNITVGIWGSMPEVYHPMEADYGAYRWPTIGDLDFSGIKASMREARTHDMVSIGAHISVGLNHHIRMRGYECAMLDVLDEAFMEDYMGRLREYFISYLDALFVAADGTIDVMRCDEDAGGNNALMINPIAWRRLYKPLWAELFDICHQNNAKVWLHSCGYCRCIMEDFIEMGADILDPVPPYVKDSDPLDMKREYGDRLCLHGGVNHIDAMIYGTPQTVRDEVKLRMEQMKPGGGYICGASQVLTDQMPLENIIALFNAAHEFGHYE
ncbi:MAG: hypothetical protein FWH01_07605 [Oscillospiraceae bacterium]|nr:hypothetical protein [Oscillospiraceae bacterium]